MNGISILKYAIIALLLPVFTIYSQAQAPYITDCGTYTAGLVPCGNSYTDTYGGVTYHCKCICGVGGGADCTPAGSGGSGGGGGLGGGGPVGTIPGQTYPGDVSSGNIMEGKALFVTHQSEAFTEWGESYKQLLESYGITSILGKDIIPNPKNKQSKKASKKGDNGIVIVDFDLSEYYKRMSELFNPKMGNSVQPLTTPAQQAKRDAWMIDNGIEKLKTIPKEGIPDLDPIVYKPDEDAFWGAFVNDPEIVKKEQHALFLGVGVAIALGAAPAALAIGATAAEAEAVGTAAAFLVPIAEEGTKAVQACNEGNCPTTGKILENMAMAALPNAVGMGGEALSGVIGKAVTVTGVNAIKAGDVATNTFKVVFGVADQTRDNMDTFNIKY